MPRHKRFQESVEDDYESVLFPKDENDEDVQDRSDEETDDDFIDENKMVCRDSEEDSGEAPESVSFINSRQDAISKIKTALQQIGAQKSKIKEKRRKIDEQFKEQKKRKLEKLSREKLSDEFLQDLPDPVIVRKSKKDLNATQKETVEDRQSVDDDEESFADTEEDSETYDLADYIHLNNERLAPAVEAETLKQNTKKCMTTLERAKAFKHQQLYGSRIRRETTQEMLAKKQKRKARFR